MKIPIPSFSDARPRNRLNLTLTLPNCQVTKLLVLKIVQLPICQVTNCQVTKLLVTKLSSYQIVSSQNSPVTNLSSYIIVSYQLVRLPKYLLPNCL